MKNLQASIQDKLRNIGKAKGLDFVLVSRLYMQEGVLRRIALSQFAMSFCLKGADYHGQRLKVECRLGTIRTNLKVDIGFGDVIYPGPLQMDYPMLLQTDSFKISAYSLESVIAEKFDAMIVLDARNSRMKDFYDIYNLLTKQNIQPSTLNKAIKLTIQ